MTLLNEPLLTAQSPSTPIAAYHPFSARPIVSKLEGRLRRGPLHVFAMSERSCGVERRLTVEVRYLFHFLKLFAKNRDLTNICIPFLAPVRLSPNLKGGHAVIPSMYLQCQV